MERTAAGAKALPTQPVHVTGRTTQPFAREENRGPGADLHMPFLFFSFHSQHLRGGSKPIFVVLTSLFSPHLPQTRLARRRISPAGTCYSMTTRRRRGHGL
jgi:hypothetical protein